MQILYDYDEKNGYKIYDSREKRYYEIKNLNEVSGKLNSIINDIEENTKIKNIAKLKTSPSVIAEAFECGCERRFICSALNSSIQEILKINPKGGQSNLSKAGDKFEEEILNNPVYNVAGRYESIPEDSLNPLEDTAELLKNSNKEYLYQTTICPPENFILKYNFPDNFLFKYSRPDLIKIEKNAAGEKIFSIIDIKLARKDKLKQKIQVTLYGLLLESLFIKHNIEGKVNLETGYIWHNGKETPTPFNMREIIPFAEQFLRTTVRKVSEKSAEIFDEIREKLKNKEDFDFNKFIDEFNCRMSYICEWCTCYYACHRKSCREGGVKSLPYLSKYSQKYIDKTAENDTSIPESIKQNMNMDEFKNFAEVHREEMEECRSFKKYLAEYDSSSAYLDREIEIHKLYQSFNREILKDIIKFLNNNDLRAEEKDKINEWVKKLHKLKMEERSDIRLKKSKCSNPYNIKYLEKRLQENIKVLEKIQEIREIIIENYKKEELILKFKEFGELNWTPYKMFVKKRTVLKIPRYEYVKIFLLAQKDEASGRLFALAISAEMPENIRSRNIIEPAENGNYIFSYVAENKNDFDRIEKEFTDKFYEILEAVHNYNENSSDKEGLSLQTYVMDGYEWSSIENAALEMLKEGRNIEKIERIMKYFYNSKTGMSSEEIPDKIYAMFPVVSLTQIVKELFILPAYIGYGMDDLGNIFEPEKPFKKYIPDYSNILTNILPTEKINDSWNNLLRENMISEAQNLMKKAGYNLSKSEEIKIKNAIKDIREETKEIQNKIKQNLEIRLIHTSKILKGIRNELNIEEEIKGSDILVSYAQKFTFPSSRIYKNKIFNSMDFQNSYENILQKLEIRNKRLGDLKEAAAENEIIQTVYTGENTDSYIFEIKNPEPEDIPELEPFVMIAENSLEGINEIHTYDDTSNFGPTKKYQYMKPLSHQDKYVMLKRKDKYILEIFKNSGLESKIGRWLKCGQEYYIMQYYTDWTSRYITGSTISYKNQVIRGILDIADNSETASNILKLINNPEEYNKKLDFSLVYNLSEYEDLMPFPFADSQKRAFLHFINNSLTLVQGPPGTGKTNFIAMALLILLIDNILKEKEPLKILISGMSHAAVDNVLDKTAEIKNYAAGQLRKTGESFAEKIADSLDEIKILKLKRKVSAKKYINVIKEEDAAEYFKGGGIVLGSSFWSLGKIYGIHNAARQGTATLDMQKDVFDIAVIDEASQVKTGDSLLALSHVKENGRILIVGDHEQLSPILKGNYEEEEECEIIRHKSLFEFLYTSDMSGRKNTGKFKYTFQLNEQFRMNDILSLYSAQQIYGINYKTCSNNIGNRISSQKMNCLKAGDMFKVCRDEERNELLEYIMDEDYPFVLCTLTGGSVSQKKKFEVNLAADISNWCRHNLLNNKGKVYDDNEDFWHNGMFIISPHHAQINLIKNALALRKFENESLRKDCFVDTVDKMQGQEADTALISYGVNDIETGMLEKEFIFSRNRLNVSITRGKKKMILFLSDALTEKQLELLSESNENVLKGINFLNGIKEFAETDYINDGINSFFDTEHEKREFSNSDGVTLQVIKKKLKK